MNLQSRLLQFIASIEYVPQNFEELKKSLNLTSNEAREAKDILTGLVEEGLLAMIKGGRYVIAKEADLISGVIRFKPNGNAVLIPDHAVGTPEPEGIAILAKDTDVALHGDHVLARLVKERPKAQYKKGKRIVLPEEKLAKVKQVLHRRCIAITGTLQRTRTHYFVLPDDPRIVHDIIVLDPEAGDLKPRPEIGQKVVVELKEWVHPHLNPEGEIIKILGVTHTPMAEYEAILYKYNLDPEFPEAVMREAESIPNYVQELDIQGRLDCRDLFTFTIDPDDAKDFDDALSLEEFPNGDTRIGIHIADVDYYVERNTEIDKEAQKRGNSTYLVGTVIPMLPHILSNGICSLVEDEDRLVKTVFITFNAKGVIKETLFANAVIRSNKRLTYHQAYAFLKENDLEKIKKVVPPARYMTGATGKALNELSVETLERLKRSIRKLWEFASSIRDKRMQKGSLDFDMPEVKIVVNKEGYADHIEVIEYDESHQLIEEYMLLANEIVAKSLLDANMPFISRVHDKPDADKLNELREFLLTFDIQTGDLTVRANVIKLLNKISQHPQGYTLKIQFLRSLKQACYRATSDGHYGLFKKYYAHFTSPIRRYADLIVHRVFDNYLIKYGFDTAIKLPHSSYSQGQLDNLAHHVSMTEQNSTEAERESVKVKLLEFFERELAKKEKTAFTAIITDIRNYGMFLELTESMAYGLLPFSALSDDIYNLSNLGMSAVGRRTGRTFTVGQIIHVCVNKVDRFKRQIDFRMAGEDLNVPVYGEKAKGKGRDQDKKINGRNKDNREYTNIKNNKEVKHKVREGLRGKGNVKIFEKLEEKKLKDKKRRNR